MSQLQHDRIHDLMAIPPQFCDDVLNKEFGSMGTACPLREGCDAAGIVCSGDVHARIRCEEVGRSEEHSNVLSRHQRPILWEVNVSYNYANVSISVFVN